MKHDGLLLVVGGGPILGDLRAAFLANQSFERPLSGYNQRLLLTQSSHHVRYDISLISELKNKP